MDDNYDEFGNYIGPEPDQVAEEASERNDAESSASYEDLEAKLAVAAN